MNSAIAPERSDRAPGRAAEEPPRPADGEWTRQEVFREGDRYFAALEEAIDNAAVSVDFEMYTFARDVTGRRFCAALVRAAGRGVSVRVLVDGIGSAGWTGEFGGPMTRAGIEWKVFHRLPWEGAFEKTEKSRARKERFFVLLRRINNRNHRKLVVVDGKTAFVGSRNVTDVHDPGVTGDDAWRDTSVVVEGPAVADLIFSFERIWDRAVRRKRRRLRGAQRSGDAYSPYVRLNLTRRMRNQNYRSLCRRIAHSRDRVWLTNAYFVPPHSLVIALKTAAERGVDVRMLLPEESDVFFIPWIARYIQQELIDVGVKVFEYCPTVLHAKTAVIDDWAIVGSSNLNHRSIMHDLEVDVVVTARAREEVARHFVMDTLDGARVDDETRASRPFFSRIGGRILFLLRHWF